MIAAGMSMALFAVTACSGSGSSSASASPAAPSATGFTAQTFSTGGTLTTLDHGHETQLEGVIASIDTAHTSFVVRTTTVNVLTTTTIRHGETTLTFADLTTGDRVHVKGDVNGSAIDARQITVQNEHTEDVGRAEGKVSGLTGTCPAIAFTVRTKKVTTSASTTFGRQACSDVADGGRVEVKGTVQTDGSILATHVAIEQERDRDKD